MAKNLKLAKTEREWWALLKSKDKTVIRSMKDWKRAISDPRNSPLEGCDAKAIAHFSKNLQFRNGGLGHADFSEVGQQLSYFQFRKLWARFGLSMQLFEDHEGYECAGKGTCHTTMNAICTSNC